MIMGSGDGVNNDIKGHSRSRKTIAMTTICVVVMVVIIIVGVFLYIRHNNNVRRDDYQSALSTIDSSRASIIEQMQQVANSFGTINSLADADVNYDHLMQQSSGAQQTIGSLRSDLANIVSLNDGGIAEYNELADRLDSLSVLLGDVNSYYQLMIDSSAGSQSLAKYNGNYRQLNAEQLSDCLVAIDAMLAPVNYINMSTDIMSAVVDNYYQSYSALREYIQSIIDGQEDISKLENSVGLFNGYLSAIDQAGVDLSSRIDATNEAINNLRVYLGGVDNEV